MTIGFCIWIVLQVISHSGYGDTAIQQKSINEILSKAMNDARQAIDELQHFHEPILLSSRNIMDDIEIPFKLWGLHTQSETNIQKLSHAALISIVATKKLKNGGIKSANTLPAVLKHVQKYCPLDKIECATGRYRTTGKYRTIDGTCNNVIHPNWGANGAPMQRIIEPFYADGICLFF
uniref:Uncharacterized protein n=1 Tax=Setaria digitata TaxID=48799 RepID=A0A915Q5U1_9BILA